MNRQSRLHLLKCTTTRGLWNASYRWAAMKTAKFNREFDRGGFAWWERAGFEVRLKPKRGQRR